MQPTLAERMIAWECLKRELNTLEVQIKVDVMQLKQSINLATVQATYSKGRGRYDWESIAKTLEPDDDIVDARTKYIPAKTTIDWRGVANDIDDGAHEDVKQANYTPGTPTVSLKLR